MTEISALEKHACPACGAQAEWNPAKQKLVCPFCGTESPYRIDRETGKVVELDLVDGAARAAGRGARLADRAPQRAVPELPGGDGLRPGARRAELRVLRLAGARRLRGDQGADPPAGRAAVPDRREPRARRHPPLVAQQVVRAGPARARGARRHRQAASTSRTGRSTRRCTARGTPRPATTTTSTSQGRDSKGRRVMRQERRVRWEPASGVVDHVFDDEPVPGTQGLPTRSAAAGRAVSDAGGRAVRHGVSLRPRRRALPGRADRRRAASRRSRCTRRSSSCARSRCPATPTATCGSIRTYLGPDVQARARAGLAAVVQLRRARRSR